MVCVCATKALLVGGDGHYEALGGLGVAGPAEHTTFQVTVELFLVPSDAVPIFGRFNAPAEMWPFR